MADEAEYAFLHVLIRDVAYGQIPRGRRADQHRLAAEWIGSLGRAEDHAEMLAHHYRNTIELRRAAGQPLEPALAEKALISLRDAGDRAFSLNAYGNAAGLYQTALELAQVASLERAHLLFKLGRTRRIGGDFDPDVLATACTELVAAGDPEAAAEVEVALAELYWDRGESDRSAEHVGRARDLMDGRGPSRAKAAVISYISSSLMLAGHSEEAIRLGGEALAMAEQLGLDEVRARALVGIGVAKLNSGDPSGLDDLQQSIALGVEANVPVVVCRAQLNLYAALFFTGKLEQSAVFAKAASDTAARFGLIAQQRFIRGTRAHDAIDRGEWNEALRLADEFLAEVEDGSPHIQACDMYVMRAQIRLGRGDTHGALADSERALELGRLVKIPEVLLFVLALCAHVLCESGDRERAGVLANEFLAELQSGTEASTVLDSLHVLAWTLSALGRGQELIAVLPRSDIPWVQAAAAFAEGDLRRAADICGGMGATTQEARDRLWLAEELVEENRRPEADVELQRALIFYRSVGAVRYIREAERLLAASV